DAATTTQAHRFSLGQTYPKPFNHRTLIQFTMPTPGEVELVLYNLLGQRVATIARGAHEAGTHIVAWDGRDEFGHDLASGVYLYRIQTGESARTRRLLLLR
ncbi:MAG: T9SS type A sorting domain-containing protein, partial [Candidatus Latescibacteria bacterium]|nr:T9SS type A sorting domain-containing protein [Candidatus Latescibacterota bacterium]